MRSPLSPSRFKKPAQPPGPPLIAAGVAMLVVAVLLPGAPATTGVALVALGATGAIARQFRGSMFFQPALAAHLVIYVSLYLLFVGAVTHMALGGSRNGLGFVQGLDLGFSAGVMGLAVRAGLAAFQQSADADVR